jgi:NhaP-type Na+/H+ and K+/H+ antiporter
MHVPIELAVLVAVFVVGAIAAAFADRIGAPALLLFLGLGIFLGVDGPGGIAFDDATLLRDVGTAALALILFEGGALAEIRMLKPVRVPAALLATVGVLRAAGAEQLEVDAATLGIDGPTLVRDLALPSRAVIAAIRREGQVVLPRGTTPVELGDVLYLLRERDPVR